MLYRGTMIYVLKLCETIPLMCLVHLTIVYCSEGNVINEYKIK